MPIGQFLAGLRFDPETKRVMGIAFEVARISLRPADRSDLADELIAHNIIYLAKAGERDFDRLCEGGLNVLRKAGSLTVPTPQRSYRHDAHEPGGTTSADAVDDAKNIPVLVQYKAWREPSRLDWITSVRPA